jgi:hypothetical protein
MRRLIEVMVYSCWHRASAGSTIWLPPLGDTLTLKMCTPQLSAFLSDFGDPTDGGPVRANNRADIAADAMLSTHDATGPDRKAPPPRVAIVNENQIERDGLVRELANTHPELTAMTFATVSECVGFSAAPDVILLRVRQGTSTQIALKDIEQLRSALPGVPVMAITAD